MRDYKFTRVLLIFCLLLLFVGYSYLSTTYADNITSKDIKSNNLNKQYINKIWDTVYGDVNGDGSREKIELIGNQRKNSFCSCMGNLKLNIRDSKSNEIIKAQLVFENSGYSPQLIISDLNNDGADDILISMNSGGNGYGHIYYALYTLRNNELKQIDLESIRTQDTHIKFELYTEDQLLLKFDGLEDNFIVPLSKYQEIVYKKIKNKEKHYADREFGSFPGSSFKIADYNGDGENELKCSKFFIGEYGSEIASLEVVYKYRDNDWKVISAKVESLYKKKSESDKAKQINTNDFQFGNLKCGLTKNEAIKILGKPSKETYFYGLRLQYDDGTRLFISDKDRIYHIEINSSNYSTYRGLAVGDSKEKVKELYGEPDKTTWDSTGVLWKYWTDDLDYLYINFKEGKVKCITADYCH